MINKPIDIKLRNLFEKVELSLDRKDLAEQPVYFGGPVQTDALRAPSGCTTKQPLHVDAGDPPAAWR